MSFIYNVTIADAQAELVNPSASETSRKLCESFLKERTVTWVTNKFAYHNQGSKSMECIDHTGYIYARVIFPFADDPQKFKSYVCLDAVQVEEDVFTSYEDAVSWATKKLSSNNFDVFLRD
jgi:hypothetical protein